MLCRAVMKKKVVVCRESDTVARCAQTMRDHNIGFIPIVDDGQQVSGVVTDRDLAVRVLAENHRLDTPLSAIMTRDVRVCRPEDDLHAAEDKMVATRKSRLVVVDGNGRCVGVISLSDVAQADNRARAGRVLHEVTRREAADAVQALVV